MLARLFLSLARDTSLKPSWRYGILLGILGMILVYVHPMIRDSRVTPLDINHIAISVMLLLSHLAFSFPWPLRTRVFLKTSSLVVVVLVCVFVMSQHRV